METKLDLCSELVSQGFVKGTKEYRREYNRLYRQRILRANPEYVKKERKKNRDRYHQKYKADLEYKAPKIGILVKISEAKGFRVGAIEEQKISENLCGAIRVSAF